MSVLAPDIQDHGVAISPLLTIRNEREYDMAMERLNELLDAIGPNAQHPLYTLLDTLGTMLHTYEEKHHPIPECSGADVLRFFMEEPGLTQAELSEVGSQGGVSEILNGKRELNVRSIRAWTKRFRVSPAVFI